MTARPAEQLLALAHLRGVGCSKEGPVTGINSDLAVSCGRIADIERRIEALYLRLAQHAAETAEARYAKTALDVLQRSLKLMYSQRDRMQSELKREQRETRRNSSRWRARVARARGQRGPELVSTVHKLRPVAREWQKRAGA